MARKQGEVMINVSDIIGKRLGKLKVISYVGYCYEKTAGGNKMRHYYRVHCDCGTDKIMRRGQLVSEHVHSCGCERGRKHYND